ncbi:uncharacterized protein B0H64DRAFT_7715 [Chaetomium fimeti]|uniref:Uncharacterized protein n=1 Tax=Chaetomium fimeti TaxID=1854472 RepID=A0AAE0LXB3_9PEZI|nr:hypothetical protein B0H64DRAFT_7715 [Chaetomium fimeti]
MRPRVYALAIILGSASIAQAAAYNRRQEAPADTPNLADGFMSMFNRLGAGAQTVTETQTITVGGDGGSGVAANATAVTVTVTAAASTVTACPGLANGAVEGVEGGGSASAAPAGDAGSGAAPPVVVASGGVGVTVIPVPDDARKTSEAGSPPAVTPPADPAVTPPSDPAATPPADPPADTPAASSDPAGASSSLAPLPSQGGADQPELVPPPGLSDTPDTPSSTPLAPLPSSQPPPAAADPSAVPIVGAPVSDSSAVDDSATSLAPPPGPASSLTDTLVLPSTVNAPVATPATNPEGAFGGVAGLIPMESAMIVTPTPTTPGVANGAGAGPTIVVSGLTLSSQLNLGNLVQQTASPIA